MNKTFYKNLYDCPLKDVDKSLAGFIKQKEQVFAKAAIKKEK